jgi:hypothetical protein
MRGKIAGSAFSRCGALGPRTRQPMTHKSMEAYCGTFEVRENNGEVIHRPELAEWPHYIGSNQIRNYRFQSDDQLILSLEEIVLGGKKYRYEVTWRRVF